MSPFPARKLILRAFLAGLLGALPAACGLNAADAPAAEGAASGPTEPDAEPPADDPNAVTAAPGTPAPTSPNAPSTPDAASPGRARSADDQNLVVGPNYVANVASQANAKVPAGKRTTLVLDANVNRLSSATADFNRTVWTYVPAQHEGNAALPLLVVQDGASYTGTVSVVLDNLIAAGKLPNGAAVFVSSGPGNVRSLEYDAVSSAYADFVTTQVLPRAEAAAKVHFSTDANLRATFGTSSGGAAAFTMAYFRPSSFSRVCTYSGSYTGLRPSAAYPHGAWGYHESLLAASPYLGLRVALEVGENDHVFAAPYRNTIVANQNMATVLMERGYATRYVYALGAGHVDGRVIQQTLPDALEWLWGDVPKGSYPWKR